MDAFKKSTYSSSWKCIYAFVLNKTLKKKEKNFLGNVFEST